MEVYVIVCILLPLICQVESTCFELKSNRKQFLEYKTDQDFEERSDFELSFKTSSENELIYYCEMTNRVEVDVPRDYEGLYIYQGFLNYFIFNPTRYGTGISRGGHVRTDFEVNNDTWITVEFFRNKEVQVPARLSGDGHVLVNQTGMIVNDKEFVFEGTIPPLDIKGSNLFIGGHEELYRIEDKLDTFEGFIKSFKDLKSNTELTPETPGDKYEAGSCGDEAPFA